MAIYIKITGNKESIMSDFIREQKKYWFVTTDKFTGIRTFQYKTSEDLKELIDELVNYLKDNKIDFKQSQNSIKLNSEFVDIYDSFEAVC